MAWPSGRSLNGGVDEIPLPTSRGGLWLCGKHYIAPDPDAALASVNATTAVCLTEEDELVHRYPGYVDWLRAQPLARALWYPIPDLHAPNLDRAVMLLDQLTDRLARGDRLLVHCGAGIGRAGTVAVGVLMSLGLSADEALEVVAASRPMAGPEVGAQRDLVTALAEHF
jgi:protein-tyrosine phosphatase